MSHALRPQSPLPSPARAARRLLWALLAGMGVAALLAAVVHLRYRHTEDLRHATERADNTARLLEENIRGVLRATGFIVAEAAAAAEAPDPAAAAARLATLRAALPETGGLAVFDAAGDRELFSAGSRPPPVNVADRTFFQAHWRGATTVIGPLVQSRTTGAAIFTVSRRIAAADGGFGGVVAAAIEAGAFGDLFDGLDLGPRAVVGVYRTDGRTVLRLPGPGRWIDTDIAGGALMRQAAVAPAGTIRGVSPLDGVERVVAYRTLPDLGVMVTCGIAISDALTPWWHDAAVTGLGLTALALLLGMLATLAFHNLDRELALMRDLEAAGRDRTEEAPRQAEEARRANEGKSRFLAGASHDLRQPLQAAGMFVEVLAARLADSPHQPLVDKLRQSIDATGTLLSTLLDISTLEAGKVRPNLTAFPLMPMLATLADQMEPDAAERGLRLSVVATSARVVSDRVLLERLLRNLMVNALRYTPAGGVVVGCRHRRGRIALQVVDSGIGIDSDKLETIFEDFTRLDILRGGARGPGLGLGVVRRTAALLGHEVEVRSRPGHGSVFTVLLPAAAAPPAAAADRAEAEDLA